MPLKKTKEKPKKKAGKRHLFRNIALSVLLVLIIGLVAARLYLPYWLKDYVNERLDAIEGYSGSVTDIDVALIRGAYQIHNLKIISDDKSIPVPFVDIGLIDLSIQWREIFHGRIVSEIYMDNANLNFAVSKNGGKVQTGKEVDWTKPIKDLMPIDINHVVINSGSVSYKDFSADSKVDLYIKNMSARVDNLRNTESRTGTLPSPMYIRGTSIGGGKLDITGRLNILRKYPDMDIDAKLEKVDLTALNNYFNDLAFIDFNRGTLNIYSEIAVKNHYLTGYVKPLATDIDMVSLEQDNNPINLIWESLASVVLEIFTNQSKDQFATKVPLEGELDATGTRFWPAFFAIIRNAFVEAFSNSIDSDVMYNRAQNEKDPK